MIKVLRTLMTSVIHLVCISPSFLFLYLISNNKLKKKKKQNPPKLRKYIVHYFLYVPSNWGSCFKRNSCKWVISIGKVFQLIQQFSVELGCLFILDCIESQKTLNMPCKVHSTIFPSFSQYLPASVRSNKSTPLCAILYYIQGLVQLAHTVFLYKEYSIDSFFEMNTGVEVTPFPVFCYGIPF